MSAPPFPSLPAWPLDASSLIYREEQHPRCHLLRTRYHKHDIRTSIVGCRSPLERDQLVSSSSCPSKLTLSPTYALSHADAMQVRAANMLDLIYKRGQAGVTKASVTIVFNNSDRATSPPDYVNQAQITVTRQVSTL